MKIFIVTEGGENKGLGHVARCSAISRAFKEKGLIAEFLVKADGDVSSMLNGQKYSILDWHRSGRAVLKMINGADIVIVDSYTAEPSFYEKISETVILPVYMDDTRRLPYPKSIVVNGAIGAEKTKYPAKKYVSYLLGTEFTPLREAFWRVPGKLIRKKIKDALIMLGGSDFKNMSPKILRFLKSTYPEFIVTIVIGSGFSNTGEIIKFRGRNIKMVHAPDPDSLKKLMLASDIAISAGGQTLYELARVGLPAIALTVVENQQDNMDGFRREGFIEDIGPWNDPRLFNRLSTAIKSLSSYEERSRRSAIGRRLIDGKGAKRIVAKLLNRIGYE